MSYKLSAKTPLTPLGVHRVLSPKAGVRVSPLAIGGMSFGDAWGEMGEMSKEETFKLLDCYYAAGGNFIDTANNYQDEQSEKWIGEWMKLRGNRDEIVIATKFTTNYKTYAFKDNSHDAANFGGNSTKSLHISLRDSLAKLGTDYVDILYLHWWDYTTSVPEIMKMLDAVVRSGKVLYLGVSDTPAWIVAKANQYARDHGLAEFVIYQGLWNLMLRDFERDILPMVRDEGMALAPWGSMGQGKFQAKKQVEERAKRNEGLRSISHAEQTKQEKKVSAALEKVAQELGGQYSVTAVAIAYILQRAPYVFPILGGRKVEHLRDNIKSIDINLSPAQVKYLESQTEFNPGFPIGFIGEDPHHAGETTGQLMKNCDTISWVKEEKAISGGMFQTQLVH